VEALRAVTRDSRPRERGPGQAGSGPA
jgi:hypothetical protein